MASDEFVGDGKKGEDEFKPPVEPLNDPGLRDMFDLIANTIKECTESFVFPQGVGEGDALTIHITGGPTPVEGVVNVALNELNEMGILPLPELELGADQNHQKVVIDDKVGTPEQYVDVQRWKQSLSIIQRPHLFKVCECCESILNKFLLHPDVCPACGHYRFDESEEAVVKQATLLGGRARSILDPEDYK